MLNNYEKIKRMEEGRKMMRRREKKWMEKVSLMLMKDELKIVMKKQMGMIGRKEKISLKNQADRIKISHAELVWFFEDLMNLVKEEIHKEELDKL